MFRRRFIACQMMENLVWECMQRVVPIEAPLVEVADALKRCLRHMGPWTLPDLTIGLQRMSELHEKEDVKDFLPGQITTDVASIHALQRDVLCVLA